MSDSDIWVGHHPVSGEKFEAQQGIADNWLLYRTHKLGGVYFAGTYTSLAEIEERFGIELEEF